SACGYSKRTKVGQHGPQWNRRVHHPCRHIPRSVDGIALVCKLYATLALLDAANIVCSQLNF
ncbi:MAG: hypothetical protein VW618_09810, partial [Alphaproteobacteria bacterium]